MTPASDIADLQAAFLANSMDLGVGLYNPSTGEIRLGSFDLVTQGQGHQGLADALGISNGAQWRGFVISSDGRFAPTSHFNIVDGGLALRSDYEDHVRAELLHAGLIL